ncbi:MAG TPA: rRNA maturation RNase YbeY [Thermoanaerobaculia bacterium]|nr:rRNA maturation RNase YbeY [Thermoanaerobaculia bacterium]
MTRETTPAARKDVDVSVSGCAVRRLSRAAIGLFVEDCLAALHRLSAAPHDVTEVAIAFVGDEEMQRLNRTYRKKNETTDVLTFPADSTYSFPGDEARPLGDIAISIDQARRQAAEEKHSLATEVRYLLLHGILHAFGYDHATDEGEMDALELKVRKRVGLK